MKAAVHGRLLMSTCPIWSLRRLLACITTQPPADLGRVGVRLKAGCSDGLNPALKVMLNLDHASKSHILVPCNALWLAACCSFLRDIDTVLCPSVSKS